MLSLLFSSVHLCSPSIFSLYSLDDGVDFGLGVLHRQHGVCYAGNGRVLHMQYGNRVAGYCICNTYPLAMFW